jgi:hypothetical protein
MIWRDIHGISKEDKEMACNGCESSFQGYQSVVVSIEKSGSTARLIVENQGRNIVMIRRILLCYTVPAGTGVLYLRPPPDPISWNPHTAFLERYGVSTFRAKKSYRVRSLMWTPPSCGKPSDTAESTIRFSTLHSSNQRSNQNPSLPTVEREKAASVEREKQNAESREVQRQETDETCLAGAHGNYKAN